MGKINQAKGKDLEQISYDENDYGMPEKNENIQLFRIGNRYRFMRSDSAKLGTYMIAHQERQRHVDAISHSLMSWKLFLQQPKRINPFPLMSPVYCLI
jgi:hypothetical protein